MDKAIHDLIIKNDKKIVLLVADGIGGLPQSQGGKTELETAHTPNMDKLTAISECGLHMPMGFGITPGSAPGHLALFGYNPISYPIGRGVVAALGIAFPLKPGDLAARINFATRDKEGRITDRRAGRIPTEKCAQLCEMLKAVSIKGIEVFVKPVKDYRAVAIFRGPGLKDFVSDTDPQQTGVKPLQPQATREEGKKAVQVTKEFIAQCFKILKDQKPANAILMRGFADLPHIPSMPDLYKLNPVALPVYPDYKGVSRLLGMDVVDNLNEIKDQLKAIKEVWHKYDYFFIHHKYTDSKGEDGNFDAKVAEIEKVDAMLPELLKLKPDVFILTGDHSTPAIMKSHSGHPVPFLIHARNIRPGNIDKFGERTCARGYWGIIPATVLIQIALSYADRIKKFGA